VGVEHDGHEAIKKSHGRHEERYTTVIYDPEGLPSGWPDVAAVILVGREREVKGVRADTSHYDINQSASLGGRVGSVRPAALVGGKRVALVARRDVRRGQEARRPRAMAGTNLSLVRGPRWPYHS